MPASQVASMENAKNIIVIAGPNGAGKTTFAKVYIPSTPNIRLFVNADMIAAGLSPFAPEREAVQAGKLMLSQITKLVAAGESFCIETTLAGKGYAQKIPHWKTQGYTVDCIFLALPNPEMAIARVAARVKQGGHNIPEDVVRRRFSAGLNNFHNFYKKLFDNWKLYANSSSPAILLESRG